MKIRYAQDKDLKIIYDIELMTFPAEEAALPETFPYRLAHFPEYFFVAEALDGDIAAFLSGRPVNACAESGITDSMYENMPFPTGDTFALLSVNTRPDMQGRGFASALIRRAMEAAKAMGCKRMILACKDEKVTFYERFGFEKIGLSASCHGGAVWQDMGLDL